jgi:hypothetical protein
MQQLRTSCKDKKNLANKRPVNIVKSDVSDKVKKVVKATKPIVKVKSVKAQTKLNVIPDVTFC